MPTVPDLSIKKNICKNHAKTVCIVTAYVVLARVVTACVVSHGPYGVGPGSINRVLRVLMQKIACRQIDDPDLHQRCAYARIVVSPLCTRFFSL